MLRVIFDREQTVEQIARIIADAAGDYLCNADSHRDPETGETHDHGRVCASWGAYGIESGQIVSVVMRVVVDELRSTVGPYIDIDSDEATDWECEPEDRWRLGRDLKDLIEDWELGD